MQQNCWSNDILHRALVSAGIEVSLAGQGFGVGCNMRLHILPAYRILLALLLQMQRPSKSAKILLVIRLASKFRKHKVQVPGF